MLSCAERSLRRTVTDTVRRAAPQVFGSALTRACNVTTRGTIAVAMSVVEVETALAPRQVLFTVTFKPNTEVDAELGDRTEQELFASDDPAKEHDGGTTRQYSSASVTRWPTVPVGLSALPPPLAQWMGASFATDAAAARALSYAADGSGSSVTRSTFWMHSTATVHPAVHFDMQPFARAVSFPTAAQIVRALGGFIGLARMGDVVGIWVLIPAVPIGSVGVPSPAETAPRRAPSSVEPSIVAVDNVILVDDEAILRRAVLAPLPVACVTSVAARAGGW